MRPKKDEVRRKILEAAEIQFLKEGFRGAGMRELVRLSGVSYGNIYKYFNHKEDILNTLMKPFADMLIEGFAEITSHKENGEEDATEIITKGLFRLYEKNRNLFLIFFLHMKGSQLDRKRVMLIDKLAIHIAHLINDDGLSRILARNFFSTIAELALQNEDPQSFKKAVTEFVSYHIRGCCS